MQLTSYICITNDKMIDHAQLFQPWLKLFLYNKLHKCVVYQKNQNPKVFIVIVMTKVIVKSEFEEGMERWGLWTLGHIHI